MRIQVTFNSAEANKTFATIKDICDMWNIPADMNLDDAAYNGQQAFRSGKSHKFAGGHWECSATKTYDGDKESTDYTMTINFLTAAVVATLNIAGKLATVAAPIVAMVVTMLTSLKAISSQITDLMQSSIKEFNAEFGGTAKMAVIPVVDKAADIYDLVCVVDDGFGQYSTDYIYHVGTAIPQYSRTRALAMDMSQLEWDDAADYRIRHDNDIENLKEMLRTRKHQAGLENKNLTNN